MIPKNPKIGFISNAGDGIGRDNERASQRAKEEMAVLQELGFSPEHLDLKNYFGDKESLGRKLKDLGGLWVCGGNTFVLRQAMKLSGFDELFTDLLIRDDFLYSGYSAVVCILCQSLEAINQVDDPLNLPYEEINSPIYEGLGVFNYAILPHYDSDHFESEDIAKEVQRCIDNKWLFKALKDGEVLIGSTSGLPN